MARDIASLMKSFNFRELKIRNLQGAIYNAMIFLKLDRERELERETERQSKRARESKRERE
jgi:hypothetical protein